LPISIGLRTHFMDLDDLMHDEKTRKKCYQLTDFVEETKVMLARFEKAGYFEDL